MDPTLWGPLAWSLIFDLNWGLCQLKNSPELMATFTDEHIRTIDAAVLTFYQSLQYMLPCKYCRESYRYYLSSMDNLSLRRGAPVGHSSGVEKSCTKALRWAYDLKNKVNDKLNKTHRPTFEQVLARMQTLHSFGSQYSLMDFLFIIAENYDSQFEELQVATSTTTTAAAAAASTAVDLSSFKQAWFYLFMKSVALLITIALHSKKSYASIASAFMKHPIQKSDVISKKAVYDYLCVIAGSFMAAPAACRSAKPRSEAE